MTSDLEATTDDLYTTIHALWQESQPATGGELTPPAGFGTAVVSISDADIAERTGLELGVVREYLDNADGVQLVVGRDGDARSVTGLL